MRVRFKSNLGSRDALAFGLDHRECMSGDERDFDNRLAEALIQKGFVSPVEEESPKPRRQASSRTTVRTVPDPVETKPTAPQVTTTASSKSSDDE